LELNDPLEDISEFGGERAACHMLYLSVSADSIDRKVWYRIFRFLPVDAIVATEGPPHKTTIHRGIDLTIGGDRAPFSALYLSV
jgi:hypothetical protein